MPAKAALHTIEKAFTEKKLGHSDLQLKNVFIRSAAYEGMLDQGLPNQDLIDHHASTQHDDFVSAIDHVHAVAVGPRPGFLAHRCHRPSRSLKHCLRDSS